ncbi:MAG: hypothetical protein ACEQSR_15065 [Candidatus Methylacidiphilales bacterium]
MKIKLVILTICFLLATKLTQASNEVKNDDYTAFSDTINKVEITLKDGTILKGELLEMNLIELKLKTDLAGIITILQVNVANIKRITNNENDQVNKPTQKPEEEYYDSRNPNNLNIVKFGGSNNNNNNGKNRNFIPFITSNKYSFSNNYSGLKKNEMLYQNIWVLYNGLDYGISNNLSVGGGFLYLFVGGFGNINLRTQFEITENIKIGAAYNMFFTYGSAISDNTGSEYFGLLTGGITVGSKENNITVSAGQGDYRGVNALANNGSNLNSLGLSVSGMAKLNNNLYIMTDNFFLKDSDKRFFSVTFRIPGKSNCFDFGLMGNTYTSSFDKYDYNTSKYTTVNREEFVPYPFLGYVYKIK